MAVHKDFWVWQYLEERVRYEGDPPEPLRVPTNAERIEKHFQELGYPFVFADPKAQVLDCGGNGCVFLVGPQLVMKLSGNIAWEKVALEMLSDAQLIGHPGLAIITPASEAFWDSGQHTHRDAVFAYLLHEVAPFKQVAPDLETNMEQSLQAGIFQLEIAASDIRSGIRPPSAWLGDLTAEERQKKIVKSLQTIYRVGRNPAFGALADLVLQAALEDYSITSDMTTKNLGFPLDAAGNPLLDEGLVAYDLHGIKMERVPGLGIYADYVFDEEEGIFQ